MGDTLAEDKCQNIKDDGIGGGAKNLTLDGIAELLSSEILHPQFLVALAIQATFKKAVWTCR